MRRVAIAAAALAFFAGAAVAQPNHDHRVPVRHGAPCVWHHGRPVLFRVSNAAGAGRMAWAGTRTPSRHDWRVLLFIARCQHNPHASSFAHAMYRGFAAANAHRRWEAAHPISYAVASWFTDYSEGTACGFHARYGVAHKTLPCGTRVTFYYGGRSVGAVVEDRGPFISGREWDLGASTAQALGFDGVDTVGYRLG